MCFHPLGLYELRHGKTILTSTSFQCFYLNINFHYEKIMYVETSLPCNYSMEI